MVELMMVVLIIGVLSALAAPQISEAMSNRRMHEAAVRVMSVYRGARAQALGRGLAQIVRYEAVGGLGRVRHVEGDRNGCSSSDWVARMASVGLATCENYLINELDLSGLDWENDGIRLDRFSLAGTTADGGVGDFVDLCFTPLGRVFYRTDPAGVFTETPVGGTGGYQLRVRRFEDGAFRGVSRYIVIPYSGTPRLQVPEGV